MRIQIITMQTVPLVRSILSGTLFSVLAGTVYLGALREPGQLFYPFAVLCFLCGPLIAAMTAAAWSYGHSRTAFLIAGITGFAIVLALFFIVYAVMPQFDRTSIVLPDSCMGVSGASPAVTAPRSTIPGTGTGELVAADEKTAVVVMIDRAEAPYPAAIYFVNRTDSRILTRMDVPDDTIIATIDRGIVYLYHDKRGYILDAGTGEPVGTFLVIDNYGGLSAADRPILAAASGERRYLETSAVISSWNRDGTVRSRARLTMNAVAFRCFVNGTTGEITQL